MADDDHIRLVETILDIPAKVMLSNYSHEIYEPLGVAGWKKIEFKTACHVVGRTRVTNLQGKGAVLKHVPRTEVLWMNYEPRRKGLFF